MEDRLPDLAGAAAKRAILAGDEAGLRAFYEARFRPLHAFCFHRLGRDAARAEEAVQETLLLALERIAEYDPARGELGTWLAFLARNVIRRANAERRRCAPGDGAASAESVEDEALRRGSGQAFDLLDQEDEMARVALALERLPAGYRSVLEMRYLREEPTRTIAAALATSEKAVESLLARAREAFRRAFIAESAEKAGSA